MTEPLKLASTREGVRLEVHARPRAKRTGAFGLREGALVVPLTSPPVDGAANEELVATLSDALDIPRRDVVLLRGATSRDKVIEIRGLHEDDVRARLTRRLGP